MAEYNQQNTPSEDTGFISGVNKSIRQFDLQVGAEIDQLNQELDRKNIARKAKIDMLEEAKRVDKDFANSVAYAAMVGEIDKSESDNEGERRRITEKKLEQLANNNDANLFNRVYNGELVEEALDEAAAKGIKINYPSVTETTEVADAETEAKESIKPRSDESALSFTQRLLRSNYKESLDSEGNPGSDTELAQQVSKEHYEANKDAIQEDALSEAKKANLSEPIDFHPESEKVAKPEAINKGVFDKSVNEEIDRIVRTSLEIGKRFGEYEDSRILVEDERPELGTQVYDKRNTKTEVYVEVGEGKEVKVSYVHGDPSASVITLTKDGGEEVRISNSKDARKGIVLSVKRDKEDEFTELGPNDFDDDYEAGEIVLQSQIKELLALTRAIPIAIFNEKLDLEKAARKLQQEKNKELL